jgi:hypothetical protein
MVANLTARVYGLCGAVASHSSRRCRSVKVRCDDRARQPTELNVIFELVGLSIQRGGHSSGTSAVLERNSGGGLQVSSQANSCGVRCNRHKRARCDPFTITDAYSRYLIRGQIVSRMALSQVRAVCEAAMREYGMPELTRTDDGAPFARTVLLGLSKLWLGWMKMGIVHERIQPGRPQQNGRHERRCPQRIS